MRSALVISERDNVATALEALTPGQRLDLGESTLIVAEPIRARTQGRAHGDRGRRSRSSSTAVPIGTASRDIAPGAHVHTHNVASSRGRGDLDRADRRSAERGSPSRRGSADACRDRTRRLTRNWLRNHEHAGTLRPGFLGYERPDGRVGTRNHVLVVPTVICASVVAERCGRRGAAARRGACRIWRAAASSAPTCA